MHAKFLDIMPLKNVVLSISLIVGYVKHDDLGEIESSQRGTNGIMKLKGVV